MDESRIPDRSNGLSKYTGCKNAKYVQGYLRGYQVLLDGDFPGSIFCNDVLQTAVI